MQSTLNIKKYNRDATKEQRAYQIATVLSLKHSMQILTYLSDHAGSTMRDISMDTKITVQDISHTLTELTKIKAVKVVGRHNKECYMTDEVLKYVEAINKFCKS